MLGASQWCCYWPWRFGVGLGRSSNFYLGSTFISNVAIAHIEAPRFSPWPRSLDLLPQPLPLPAVMPNGFIKLECVWHLAWNKASWGSRKWNRKIAGSGKGGYWQVWECLRSNTLPRSRKSNLKKDYFLTFSTWKYQSVCVKTSTTDEYTQGEMPSRSSI